ncbi:hypothetical protein HDU93_001364 [Gonapodya sp. JEL0774]|nr:hypothetical protein HDU93_001364 [Gonapodya sp. JEL0774]
MPTATTIVPQPPQHQLAQYPQYGAYPSFTASPTLPSSQPFGRDAYSGYQFDSRMLEQYWAQAYYQTQMAQYYASAAYMAAAANQTPTFQGTPVSQTQSATTAVSASQQSPDTEDKMDIYQNSEGKLMSTASSASVAAKPAGTANSVTVAVKPAGTASSTSVAAKRAGAAVQPKLELNDPADASSAKRPIAPTPDVSAGSASAVPAAKQAQQQQLPVSRKEIVVGRVHVVERVPESIPARSASSKPSPQDCLPARSASSKLSMRDSSSEVRASASSGSDARQPHRDGGGYGDSMYSSRLPEKQTRTEGGPAPAQSLSSGPGATSRPIGTQMRREGESALTQASTSGPAATSRSTQSLRSGHEETSRPAQSSTSGPGAISRPSVTGPATTPSTAPPSLSAATAPPPLAAATAPPPSAAATAPPPSVAATAPPPLTAATAPPSSASYINPPGLTATLPMVPRDTGPFLFIPPSANAFSNAANSNGPIPGPGHGSIRTHDIQSLSKAARKKLRRGTMAQAAEIGVHAPLAQFVLSTTSVVYNPEAPNTWYIAFPLPSVLPKPQPMPTTAPPSFVPVVGSAPPPPHQARGNLSVTAPSRPTKNGNTVKDLGIAAFAADVANRLQPQPDASSDSDSESEWEMPKSVKPKIVNVRPGPRPYSVEIATGGTSVVMFGDHQHSANPPAPTRQKRPLSPPPTRQSARLKSAKELDRNSPKVNSTTERPDQHEEQTPGSRPLLFSFTQALQAASYGNKKPKDSDGYCKRCDYLGKHIVRLKAEREAHRELAVTFRDSLLVLMRVVNRAMDERRSSGDLQSLPENSPEIQQSSSAVVDHEDNAAVPMDMCADQANNSQVFTESILTQIDGKVTAHAETSVESNLKDTTVGSEDIFVEEGEVLEPSHDSPQPMAEDPGPINSASPGPDQTMGTTPAARRYLLSVLNEFELSFSAVDRISVLTGVDLLEVVGRHVRGTAVLSGRTAVSITPDATETEDLMGNSGPESEIDRRVTTRASEENKRRVAVPRNHAQAPSEPIDVDAMFGSNEDDDLADMDVVWVKSDTGHWGLGLKRADRPVEKSEDRPQKKRKLNEQASASAQAPKVRKKNWEDGWSHPRMQVSDTE